MRLLLIAITCLALGACAGQPVTATVSPSNPSSGAIVAAPASLPATTGNPVSDLQGLITQFGTFTSKDLDIVEADAEKYNDTLMIGCPPAIKAWLFNGGTVGGIILPDSTNVAGALSAYELARINRLNAQANITGNIVPIAVKKACGAYFLDEENFWVKFTAMISVGVASGGAAPAVGGILSGIGVALPIPLK